MDPQATPQKLGRYRLLEKLATGGMAEIYLALSSGAGGFEKLLVVKRILPHLATQPEFIRMFLREARVSANLQHQNIVQIFDVEEVEGSHFITMEYVQGLSLAELLQVTHGAGVQMPLGVAVFVARELLQGLAFAHEFTDGKGQPLNIIHRDVSPSNILISVRGDVKIADFGIAKARTSEQLTETGILKGKVGYIAPEQLQGKNLDQRSDIFSAGVVLHEMITGVRLFKGTSDFHTIQMIMNDPIPPPSERRPEVPPALDAVVMGALRRDRTARYQSCSELADAMTRYYFDAGLKTTRKELAAYVGSHAGKLVRGRRAMSDLTVKATPSYIDLSTTHVAAPSDVISISTGDVAAVTTDERLRSTGGIFKWAAMVVGALAILGAAAAWMLLTQRPTLHIWSDPNGAAIFLDGSSTAQTTPAIFEDLEARIYDVELRLEGHQPWKDKALLKTGETSKVEARLAATAIAADAEPEPVTAPPTQKATSPPKSGKKSRRFKGSRRSPPLPTVAESQPSPEPAPVKAAPPPATAPQPRTPPPPPPKAPARKAKVRQPPGTIDINTIPWTVVSVDGKKVGNTPITDLKLPPGRHTLRLRNSTAGIDITETVVIKSGKKVRFARRLK